MQIVNWGDGGEEDRLVSRASTLDCENHYQETWEAGRWGWKEKLVGGRNTKDEIERYRKRERKAGMKRK